MRIFRDVGVRIIYISRLKYNYCMTKSLLEKLQPIKGYALKGGVD